MAKPEFFPPGALDHTVYLTRLASAGANYIFAGGGPHPTNLIRDAHKLGLTKTIQFMNDYWGPTEPVGIRAHPEALEGTVITSYYLRGEDAKTSRLRPVDEISRKTDCRSQRDLSGRHGLGHGFRRRPEDRPPGCEGTRNSTGRPCSRLIEARRVQAPGITGINAYSPTSRREQPGGEVLPVKGSRAVAITDWIKAPDSVSLHKF
jgi:hypothetical protein